MLTCSSQRECQAPSTVFRRIDMRVAIIRHAEVNFSWSRRCTSGKFDSECRKYDHSPIRNVTYSIPQFVYQRIYVSELSRSKDTAEILFPQETYYESGLINEVPLKSSLDTKMNMPLWFWNLTGRLQWFADCSRQAEGHRQTWHRIKEPMRPGNMFGRQVHRRLYEILYL